jgi:REP element-mobilizing transposase RayT
VLEEVRRKLHFLLVTWVRMPEQFHLLIQPEPAETTPKIMKELKEESAKRILRVLRANHLHPRCGKILAGLRFPSTVHDESHYGLWQRRFDPVNVFSDQKYQEKSDYNNPEERRLVNPPGEWPGPTWRFHDLDDASILRMDRLR